MGLLDLHISRLGALEDFYVDVSDGNSPPIRDAYTNSVNGTGLSRLATETIARDPSASMVGRRRRST
ncbi:MAG TPA: hypothetical protein VJX71_05470 [Methylomirabilota bacterium]|nr:hypothetical protein [Methylomirabilota bacterium]